MKITLKCTVMCLISMFVFSSACAQDLTDDGNKKYGVRQTMVLTSFLTRISTVLRSGTW